MASDQLAAWKGHPVHFAILSLSFCCYYLTIKWMFIPNQQQMRGCVLGTVATDALVWKHLGISIHSVDRIFII